MFTENNPTSRTKLQVVTERLNARAGFYTRVADQRPKLLTSHGALQSVQNKLILEREIPKLDQPMSDREAQARQVTPG